VLAGDMNANAYGKALADGFFLMPSSDDEVAYLSAIRKVCLEESVDVILPITTRELGVLARHKDTLAAEGVRVVVSGSRSIDIANDKGKSADFAQKLGLPVPRFKVVRDLEEFQTCVVDMQLGVDKLCFKPVLGNGSRGFGIIVKEVVAGEFLQAKAGVLPMTLAEWCQRLGGDGLFEVPLMICDFLPGIEYSVDMLCSGGKTLFCVPRTRDKMIGGISVAGRLDRNFGLIAFLHSIGASVGIRRTDRHAMAGGFGGHTKVVGNQPAFTRDNISIGLGGNQFACASGEIGDGRSAEFFIC
jgi:carbamoyl-phosphate synthase large subunit